jgi:hypothetical protein|tara:strand:- start:142 stop:585 length:444 start_codon:yes stop_codon:yes gene_type:complete
MFFISHRGNLYGPEPENENSIDYINKALDKNFDVEIDLWFKEPKFFLGHDNPKNLVTIDFLKNKKFWIHAKNLECFYELSNYDVNYFWHEEDEVIITSKGYFWNYPGTKLSAKSICVLPEKNNIKKVDCLGYCSDHIMEYYDRYNNI